MHYGSPQQNTGLMKAWCRAL